MVILVWETDKDLNPLGEEWVFKSASLRDCVSQISYTKGGRLSMNRKMATLPNGNRICAKILSK